MKVQRPDAYTLNLKMIYNDLSQLQKVAERAANSSSNNQEYSRAIEITEDIARIKNNILEMLDK